MRKYSDLIINYEGLKNGNHEYSWEIEEDFFGIAEELEFSNLKIKVDAVLHKEENMMFFEFNHSGNVDFSCDLCLEELTFQVEGENKLIVHFGEEETGDGDTMITISRSEYEFDVSPFLHDYIMISLPWKRECAMVGKECNPEMIKKMEEFQAKSTEESDPRWDALKKLL